MQCMCISSDEPVNEGTKIFSENLKNDPSQAEALRFNIHRSFMYKTDKR